MSIMLSIIIPVYKVEEYIQECLQSVFTQIPAEGVEIIVVDDGSPDQSMPIIRREFHEWISSGVLIQLEQENKGPGGARNLGMAHAKGKYIGFLDGDDILLDGYFDELMDRIDLSIADMIEFGFKRFRDIKQIKLEQYDKLYSFNGIVSLDRSRKQVFAQTRWFPSLRVYRRAMLNGFSFKERTHYEDLIAMPKLFSGDRFVLYIDRPLLGYRERRGSITSKHTKEQMLTLYKYYASIPLDAEPAFRILKLSIARTLSYFYYELRPDDFPMNGIIEDLKQIEIDRNAQKYLPWPDYVLLKMPSFYMKLNKLRFMNIHRRNKDA